MAIDVSKTLLLLIDIQNDFCPGGALAVQDGDKVIQPLNVLAKVIAEKGGRVAATQDWHPAGHVSFGMWPDHCVQGTTGADFHKDLDTNPVSLIVRKGFRPNLDSYSAFFENDRKTSTGLEGWIKTLGLETIILGGLATDYCVFFSAMDSKQLGFQTIVISDAIRGVGLPKGSIEKATEAMNKSGIIFSTYTELLDGLK